MPSPILTVGFAHHRDYHGAYFTLQSLKLNTPPELLRQIQLIAIDQTPDDPHGKELAKLMGYARIGVASAKYITFTERTGTSHSREKIFKEADGDVVLVLDCHVLLQAGAIENVIYYFNQVENVKNILSGPILTDAVRLPNGKWAVMATHYANHWRAEMWGTWSNAWACRCGEWNFAAWEEGGLVRYESCGMDVTPVKVCPKCNEKFPLLSWSGHETPLQQFGYKHLGMDGETPFEIPAQGLGLFAMRRESWPGMPADLYAFGGEELSLHEHVRHNGGKAVCHPGVRWVHRFPRPEPSTFPNTHWYKCRNYVVWFKHLAEVTGDKKRFDLDIIRKHFVEQEKTVSPSDWEAMVSKTAELIHGPTEQFSQPVVVGGQPTAYYRRTMDEVFEATRKVVRDLDQHLSVMREFGRNCRHITEFSKRKESTVAWTAALIDVAKEKSEPKPRLVSHNVEQDNGLAELAGLANVGGVEFVRDAANSLTTESIEPTDLLWFDTVMHADRVRIELMKFAKFSRRYIIIRGTGAFGNEAEGSGPGMFEALRPWVQENPDWFVAYHANNQYGLTVLSCNPEDKPLKELIPWPPGWGTGTELKNMLAKIGVHQLPGCDCLKKMIEMDVMGVAWCRENQKELAEYLHANAPRWGWQARLEAAVWATITGLVFSISVTHPFQGLVKEALQRATAEEKLRSEGRKKV